MGTPSWPKQVKALLAALRGLIPWADLSVLAQQITPDGAAHEIHVMMWRLRGMRDGISLVTTFSGAHVDMATRISAINSAVAIGRAYSLCCDVLKAISPGAPRIAVTPEWPKPKSKRRKR